MQYRTWVILTFSAFLLLGSSSHRTTAYARFISRKISQQKNLKSVEYAIEKVVDRECLDDPYMMMTTSSISSIFEKKQSVVLKQRTLPIEEYIEEQQLEEDHKFILFITNPDTPPKLE